MHKSIALLLRHKGYNHGRIEVKRRVGAVNQLNVVSVFYKHLRSLLPYSTYFSIFRSKCHEKGFLLLRPFALSFFLKKVDAVISPEGRLSSCHNLD